MLRNGILADAEDIEAIKIAAWRAGYQKFMPADFLAGLDATQNIARLRQRLACQNRDFSVAVAEHEQVVTAFSILGKPRFEAPSTTIELWALNVHPRYSRMGLGLQLIENAIESSQAAGFESIEL